MKNQKNDMIVPGIILVSVSAIAINIAYPPDSNFILAPGFGRREEIGYIHDQEYKYNQDCDDHIYVNKIPNHIATLTSKFDDAIKVKVTAKSNNSNPIIIIKSPNEEIHLCEDNPGDGEVDDQEEIVFFSYEYVQADQIPAGTYQVWVGDRKKHNSSTKYIVEVTEEEDF